MKLWVVILDQEKSLRKLLALIVQKQEHEVLAFAEPLYCPLYTGQNSSCPRDKPCADLMIIDNRMPRMSAINLIKEQSLCGCKASIQNKLILSTSRSEQDLAVAQGLGCEIIRKPFKSGQILNWIADHAKMIAPERELAKLDFDSYSSGK